MKQIMERRLRSALERPDPTKAFRLQPFGFGGNGPMTLDWAAIRELAYEGRGGVAPLELTE